MPRQYLFIKGKPVILVKEVHTLAGIIANLSDLYVVNNIGLRQGWRFLAHRLL